MSFTVSRLCRMRFSRAAVIACMPKKIGLLWICLLGAALQCPAAVPLYLENEVESALHARDECYKRLLVADIMFPFPDNANALEDSLAAKTSRGAPDSSAMWYYFLLGLAFGTTAPDSQSRYFSYAIRSSGDNPANLLALSMEFGRCRQWQWESRGLEKLYKLFLILGVSDAQIFSVPPWSQTAARTRGDQSAPAQYEAWAQKFSPYALWPSMQAIMQSFPAQIPDLINESAQLMKRIGQSWQLQAFLALHLVVWLRWLLVLFSAAVVAVAAIRYAPSALHPITELFPSGISQTMKLYFACVLFASLLSCGVLPVLWLLIVLFWKFSSKRDKWLLGIAAAGLLMLPLAVRVEDMLRQCQSPRNTPALYSQTRDAGFSADMDFYVRAYVRTHPDDYLAFTSASIYAVKRNDLATAALAVGRARELCDNDPVVLMTDGIISYYAGDFLQARAAFETCAKMYPDYAPGFFNFGQSLLASNETFKGMEYIDRATKLNPFSINSFIKINDDYFSKNWPRMRQLMLPEYPSNYFWEKVFPRYWGNFRTANVLWGGSFWGISMEIYFFAGLLALCALLILTGFVWSGVGARKIFLCKLCGAAMCRQCKKGMICSDCFQAVQPIRNENIRQRIIEKIVLKNQKTALWVSYCLDIVFPGSGMLYKKGCNPAVALVFMGLTSGLIAALLTLPSLAPLCACPHFSGFNAFMVIILGVYMAAFAVRASTAIKKEIHR